jgi:hypothetical protein
MDVVVVLGSVVEEAGIGAERLLDDVFEREIGEAGFGRELVAVVDISLVVLVVVELQGFLRHERLQRFVVVGKFRQFKSHCRLLLAIVCVIGR